MGVVSLEANIKHSKSFKKIADDPAHTDLATCKKLIILLIVLLVVTLYVSPVFLILSRR